MVGSLVTHTHTRARALSSGSPECHYAHSPFLFILLSPTAGGNLRQPSLRCSLPRGKERPGLHPGSLRAPCAPGAATSLTIRLSLPHWHCTHPRKTELGVLAWGDLRVTTWPPC